jgi:hypothetical protein
MGRLKPFVYRIEVRSKRDRRKIIGKLFIAPKRKGNLAFLSKILDNGFISSKAIGGKNTFPSLRCQSVKKNRKLVISFGTIHYLFSSCLCRSSFIRWERKGREEKGDKSFLPQPPVFAAAFIRWDGERAGTRIVISRKYAVSPHCNYEESRIMFWYR